MARQTLILAKNITEANHYAKVIGLERFSYRAVRNAGAIRGVRNAEVHLLSSFAKRLDRHAILASLRWARLDVFYVAFENGQIVDSDISNMLEIPEGMTERQLEAAYRYNAIRDGAFEAALDEHLGIPTEEESEQTGTTEPSETPAPKETKRRRRTRCKDCGALHFSEEPCEELPAPASPVPNFTF